MSDPLINSPNAVHQRNLAEIEYDWLAAVVERLFLGLFLVLFFFMSVGIILAGGYYCKFFVKLKMWEFVDLQVMFLLVLPQDQNFLALLNFIKKIKKFKDLKKLILS